MKEKIIWFPVFVVLIVTIMFSGCATKKDLSSFSTGKDLSSLLVVGAVVGVVGLISLFVGDGVKNTISLDNYESDIKESEFSSQETNTVHIKGEYKKVDFLAAVAELKDVKDLVLDLSSLKNMSSLPEKAFYEYSNIKEVILPKNLESIGDYAFTRCKKLEKIKIPENVSEIGEGAFMGCYELTKIELPKKITQIKYGTFSSCDKLQDVIIPENVNFIGEEAFSYCESFVSIVIPETVTTVEDSAFFGSGMEKVTIKTELKNVSKEAFFSCPNLKYIAIESTGKYDEEAFVDFLYRKSIGSSDIVLDLANFENMETFPKAKDDTSNNKYIAKVILPNNLKVIGEKAFQYWENLESVVIPETVTSIEPYAFSKCTKLRELKLPENIQIISFGVFESTAIKELEIPQNVRNIEEDAFRFCKNLETVTIKGDIETICKTAFANCQNLKKITFKKTVKNIGEQAFSNCGFETFSAPKGLESLGSLAFAECKDLRTLKNLENVKIITSDDGRIWDFIEGCSNLEYLSVPSSVEIPEGWDPINIAGDLKYYNYKKLKFGVASDSPMFSTASNGEALLSKDGKALYAWPSASGTIKIPDTVEEISFNVFGNNESVESVTLSKNIIEIPHFYQCHNLKTLIIPEGITELLVPYDAGSCEKLELLQIPSSLTVMGRKSSSDSPTIDQLSVPTFYSTNLKFNVAKNNQFFSTSKDGRLLLSKDGKILFAWPSASGDITIPDGIEEIADNALRGIKINKLTIGEHVKKIGESAFSGSEVVSLEIYSNNTEFMTGVFSRCSNLERVSITGPVNTISHYMFQECSKLCDVSIPSLKSIDDAAFMDCIALTRFVIPENLEDIGEEAFWNCENLNFFDVSKSKNFKTTNNGTTLLSKDGEIMYFWAGVSGSVIIPEGVKKLNTEVFSAKSGPITSVTLPKSLEDLGGTFDVCALSLYPDNPVINFCGTEEEWQDLKATAGYWAEKDLDELPVICNYKY